MLKIANFLYFIVRNCMLFYIMKQKLQQSASKWLEIA